MSDDGKAAAAGAGPGTPSGPTMPTAAGRGAPSAIDLGRVEGGRVAFANWKGDADRPPPPPPAPLPPDGRVGFAIAGLGRLSLEEIMPAFGEARKARITALVSGSPDKARAVGAQYGVRPESIYSYDDWHRLAGNPDVSAVYVVTAERPAPRARPGRRRRRQARAVREADGQHGGGGARHGRGLRDRRRQADDRLPLPVRAVQPARHRPHPVRPPRQRRDSSRRATPRCRDRPTSGG